jgi:DNA-binding PadR family transcriptional regulator
VTRAHHPQQGACAVLASALAFQHLQNVGACNGRAKEPIRDDSQSSRRSLKHLENEGLIRTSPISSDDRAVALTDRGRDLLEANRYERDDRIHQPRQTFYAGVKKPRELTHDTRVYRAYERAEERLRGQGGRVRRVVLDYELKRDYQRFLQLVRGKRIGRSASRYV